MSSVVRLGHSLNEAERQHVSSRRETVQQCLQKHNIPCTLDEVPNIAVLGSGGGERAMIGLLGSLSQLGEEGLLDCIMYLSGVSGSTWCMSSVYKEPDWSTKMETVGKNIIQRLVSGHVSQSEQHKKLEKLFKRDNFSLTDIWASCIVPSVVKEIDEHVLTEQRGQHTRDPYPIYTVIDKQCSHDRLYKDVWFEITPDECGYSLTGAFVDSRCLGNQFKNGIKIKEQPEIDMLYLQGLCGSALADEAEIRKWIGNELQQFFKMSEKQMVPKTKEGHQILCALLDLIHHFFREEDIKKHITKINELLKGKFDKEGNELKLDPNVSKEQLKKHAMSVCHCFLDWFSEHKGLGILHLKCIKKLCQWNWGATYNFLYTMAAAEVHPSILKSETRQYEDAGLLLNSPYFSVLRKERNVDLIISLDFSAGDPFETVYRSAQMCTDLQIPFPTVKRPGPGEELHDFYVFKDNKAPTVIHIPLFNVGNCKGEVEKWKKRYHTFQSAYSDKTIRDLLEKAAQNITNTKEKLLKEVQDVVQRKKKH
ncbi:cytosolic phospholipase A2 gamma-like [Brachyhypopomus gauderio]|uniref:cytosolic phospholipase A2 gamma-like n=1 Tax=Brachyhypopomus gauderio TaxID=698409 RepID=UPI004042A6B8